MNELKNIVDSLLKASQNFNYPGWYWSEAKEINSPNYKDGLGLSRGHNISVVKDDAGNIVKNIFEIEYTPFSKENVSVKISDGMLTVKFSKKESDKKTNELKEVIFDGIYSEEQEFSFSIPSNTDEDKITAKCVDGILKIDCPVLAPVKEEKKKERSISIG